MRRILPSIQHWSAIAVGVLLGASSATAQIILNQTQPPATLVQNQLMGPGVFATGVTFNGNPGTVVPPLMTTLGQMGRFNGANTSLGINGGIFLCTNNASSHIPGPNDQLMQLGGGLGGGGFWASPDIDLSQLSAWPYWQVSAGGNIGNKAVLEFDFIPMKDMVSFRYVFSSEEYERWACSQYNDVFGFFISGPGIPTNINGPFTNNAMNLAMIPGSLSRVSINTVNSGLLNASNANGPDFTDPFRPCFDADPNWQANAQYYRSNGGEFIGFGQVQEPFASDAYYIQHNGMTVVLTASAAVECGQTYHLKLALGNVADNWFPSAVFIEGGSFRSSDRFSLTVDEGPNVEYTANDTIFIENDCDSVYLRFHRWGGFYLDEDLQISVEGTATNGVDVVPTIPGTVHFDQLDSTSVIAIAVPVDGDGVEELVIRIITCNGSKIQTYRYTIDQRAPLVVTLDDQTLTCPGEVTLTPTVTGGGEDPAEYTYMWNTGETTASITAMVLSSTQFWVTVKDCWSEAVTDSAWVFVPPYDPMVLTLTPDTAIPCLGTAELEVEATLGSGGYTYSWLLNTVEQGTNATLTVPAPLGAVYYVVEVTDQCGVVAMDSVLVTQAPPTPLVLTLPPDTAIACLGNADLAATVTGGGGVISYGWTNSAGAPVGNTSVINVPAAELETYTVTVSDQCGQTISGQVEVTTGPTPPLSITAIGDTVLCAGAPMVLQVVSVSGGGGAYNYVWTPGGTGSNGGTTYEVRVDDDAIFTLTVTDACGNSADTTLAAVVLDHAPLLITVSNDTIVCPGEQVPLWVEVSGGAGTSTITWPGLGTGSAVVWTAAPGGLAAVVNVTDACGQTVSSTVVVDVYPAQAWIEGQQLGDSEWRFQAITSPAEGVDLEWDLGDGTLVSGVTVVQHTYADVEAHWVYLYMETPEGCTAVDSMRTVPPSATIYFPNAFSPNGDGINESFGGEGVLLDRYELYVFDRWGGIIFQSKDQALRWDGTQKGEPVMNGVYQYKYLVRGLKMPLKQGFGHVMLVR
jgi:gliding motility-associated-like protein